MDIWVPEMLDVIPGKLRTMASTTTSTMTLTSSRTVAGIIGVKGPQEPDDELDAESVIFSLPSQST